MSLDDLRVRNTLQNPEAKKGTMTEGLAGALLTSDDMVRTGPYHVPTKLQGYLLLDEDIMQVTLKWFLAKGEIPPAVIKEQTAEDRTKQRAHDEDIRRNLMEIRTLKNRDEEHRKDAEDAGKGELAEMGRYRLGHRDTGETVIHHVSVKQNLIAGLRNLGFKIVSAWHYYHKDKRQYVIQVIMRRLDHSHVDYSVAFADLFDEVKGPLRKMLELSWIVDVWDNRNVYEMPTVNFTGGHQPRIVKNPANSTKALRIRNREMRLHDE